MESINKWLTPLNTLLIAVLVAAALVGGNQSAPQQQTAPQQQKLGGSTQDSFSIGNDLTVADDATISGDTIVEEFTQGGGITTLTDANGGTYTLTEAELLTSSVLKFAAGGAGQAVVALTLPASSTLATLLPSAGDMRSWIYDASDLAAATTTTITAGTGIDLIAYTANDDVIDGAEFAVLTCWRQADTDVSCITSELLHAD